MSCDGIVLIVAFVLLCVAQMYWNIRCATKRDAPDRRYHWRGGWRN